MSVILCFFIFSSWGLGLLAALLALSMRLQEHSAKMKSINLEIESDSLDFSGKKAFFDKVVSLRGGSNNVSEGLPEEIKNLMKMSPEHPEVNEIEDGDDLVGILFKAHSYPPGLEDDDTDDDDQDD
jgi:hypothetical protein